MARDNLLAWKFLGVVSFNVFKKRQSMTPAQNRVFYKPAFKAATQKYNLPPGLLERVAQQECSFRSDTIHGGPNKAGAIGIMQIVPRWHPQASPKVPHAAIDYGAGFLKDMYDQFGNWQDALAAYNYGSGNVTKYLAGQIKLPRETIKYKREILRGIGLV